MSSLDDVAERLRSRTSIAGRPVERATLADRMAELHLPAVSVAVLEPGGDVIAQAWGATPGTLFQAASISKPVTAMATMRLASDGFVDLDADVNAALRNWRLPDGEGVTPRRILSHTAGLSVHGFPGYARSDDVPSLVQILDGAPPANTEAVRVFRPPGEGYQYSGGGYTLLQLLIEDVTGEPFADLMRRVVLDPLGMPASTYEQPLPAEKHSSAATGHDIEGKPLDGGWVVHPEQAAAGLWTNPAELVRVAGEMIRPGAVLDDAARDAMLTPQTDDFGIGLQLEGDWFQHGGSNAGFQCLLYGSVPHRCAAVVMTNGDAGGLLCADVIATVAEIFGWPGFLREREVVQLDAATLDAISGEYDLGGDDAVISIRRDGNVLVSSAPGLPERELFAVSPTDFFRLDLRAEVHIEDGTMTVAVGSVEMTARRRS